MERLDDLVHSIDVRDRLQRFNTSVRRFFTPLAAAAALYAGVATSNPEFETRYTQPTEARYEQSSKYNLEGEFYVHVPSWVKLRKVPAHVTGPNLYGYTFPSTGYAFIRDDLFDDHEKGELNETEVTLHEVLHNMYPNAPEEQIRGHVRSILGSRAVIHSRLG